MAPKVMAKLWSGIPAHFHYQGEPNAWVKMTRPGQRLHSFIEGPCWDAQGNLWLVDVPYGRIFKISPDGIWQLALEYDGQPHAIKYVGEGQWLIVDYARGLMTYDGGRQIQVLADSFDGKPFLGLSDLFIASDGTVWFTDSGRTSLSNPVGRIFNYKLSNRSILSSPRLALEGIPYPNGIALSPCGAYVYCAVTRANAIWRFSTRDPHPERPMVGVWAHVSGGLGPDGLAVDQRGHVAVAQAQAGRAYVFSPLGDLLATVMLPEGLWTTALAFGNDDHHLYITEAQTGSVYVVPTSTFLD